MTTSLKNLQRNKELKIVEAESTKTSAIFPTHHQITLPGSSSWLDPTELSQVDCQSQEQSEILRPKIKDTVANRVSWFQHLTSKPSKFKTVTILF